MRFLSWNCQGLGVALTIKNLKEVCKKHNPQLVFLMETKQKEKTVSKLRRRCGFDEEWIINPVGLSGGLAIWWKSEINVNILHSSHNIIHTSISSLSVIVPEYLTCVYSPPNEVEQRKVWEKFIILLMLL